MYRKKFIKNFPYITKYPVKELLDINISDNTSPEFGHETSQRPLKDALKKRKVLALTSHPGYMKLYYKQSVPLHRGFF